MGLFGENMPSKQAHFLSKVISVSGARLSRHMSFSSKGSCWAQFWGRMKASVEALLLSGGNFQLFSLSFFFLLLKMASHPLTEDAHFCGSAETQKGTEIVGVDKNSGVSSSTNRWHWREKTSLTMLILLSLHLPLHEHRECSVSCPSPLSLSFQAGSMQFSTSVDNTCLFLTGKKK